MIAVPGDAGEHDRVDERRELADRGQHEEPAQPIQRAEQHQEVRRLQPRRLVAEGDRRDQQREPAQPQREQELRRRTRRRTGTAGARRTRWSCPVRIIMFPTSSSTPFVGRNARSATALNHLFCPPGDRSAAAAARGGKPTSTARPKPSDNRHPAPARVVSCGRFEVVEKAQCRTRGQAHNRRRAGRLRQRRAPGRQRAERQLPRHGRRRPFPASQRLASSRPGDRRPQHRHEDDPEHRGHDLQRHLRLLQADSPAATARACRRSRRISSRPASSPTTRGRCGSSTRRRTRTAARNSCQQGGPGGAVTAYSNTWALGSLKPEPDGDVRLGGDRGQARAAHRRLAGGGRTERQGQGA